MYQQKFTKRFVRNQVLLPRTLSGKENYMGAGKNWVALVLAVAMLVAPLAAQAAQARHYNWRYAHRPLPAGYYNPGYYGYGYGSGWRHRSNARGWDNTCLDLPWLPSEFACSAK
jgi:hypothetical protein